MDLASFWILTGNLFRTNKQKNQQYNKQQTIRIAFLVVPKTNWNYITMLQLSISKLCFGLSNEYDIQVTY